MLWLTPIEHFLDLEYGLFSVMHFVFKIKNRHIFKFIFCPYSQNSAADEIVSLLMFAKWVRL